MGGQPPAMREVQRGVLAADARHSGQDRQPVAEQELVLAADARVEELERERCAGAEQERHEQCDRDAQLRARPRRAARLDCRRGDRHRRVGTAGESLQLRELRAQIGGGRRVELARRQARDSDLSRAIVVVSAAVEVVGALVHELVGKRVAMSAERARAACRRVDRDDVALAERLHADRAQECISAHAERVASADPLGHLRRLDQPGRGQHTAREPVGLSDHREPVER